MGRPAICRDIKEIVVDSKLSEFEQLKSEIAQLKAMLLVESKAEPQQRALATRRLMDIRKSMLGLLSA